MKIIFAMSVALGLFSCSKKPFEKKNELQFSNLSLYSTWQSDQGVTLEGPKITTPTSPFFLGLWNADTVNTFEIKTQPLGFDASFGQCSTESTLRAAVFQLSEWIGEKNGALADLIAAVKQSDSCEVASALGCFQQGLALLPRPDSESQKADTLDALSKSIANCIPDGQIKPYFALSTKAAVFYPAPLLSIAIYPQTKLSYQDALAQLEPLALFPADKSCTIQGCLNSPLAIANCIGCNKLNPGTTYSVFLLGLKTDRTTGQTERTDFRYL